MRRPGPEPRSGKRLVQPMARDEPPAGPLPGPVQYGDTSTRKDQYPSSDSWRLCPGAARSSWVMYMGCLGVTVTVSVSTGGSAATRAQVFPSQLRRPCQCQPCFVLIWGMWSRGECGPGSPVWARVADAVNFYASFVSEWCCSSPSYHLDRQRNVVETVGLFLYW